jgi:hypothetical protein
VTDTAVISTNGRGPSPKAVGVRNSWGWIKPWVRQRLWTEAHGRCTYCQRVTDVRDQTVDHVLPLSRGGWDEEWNLLPCCLSCNSSKGGLHPLDWIRYRLPYRLIDLGYEDRRWLAWHLRNVYACACSILEQYDARMAAPLYHDHILAFPDEQVAA